MTIAPADPGRVVQFVWGTPQYVLTLSYPATADDAKFWTAPQAGSELGPVNDLQDAWVIGRDWFASMTLRWLLPKKWCEVQAFLDSAMTGVPFAFIPDAGNAPLFAIPGCVLVQPFGDPAVSLEDNGMQMVEITFRNSTYDLGLAWR